MQASNDFDEIYAELKRLVIADPRAARIRFTELWTSKKDLLMEFLDRLGNPGEGRLRHFVANFARTIDDRSTIEPHLVRWLETETDEFARRSIQQVLEARLPIVRPAVNQQLVPKQLVDVYRYVSERMRHELQNALLGPKTRILQIRSLLDGVEEGLTRSELEALVLKLRDEFHSLGRMAESEPDDVFFQVRPVALKEWLHRMNIEYSGRFNRVDLEFDANPECPEANVMASDYLLRLIFWNLWINAHQVVGDPCEVRITIDHVDDRFLKVTITDNGAGFASEMRDIAFEDRYSKNGPHRGRGLLEIQDAILQLRGNAMLAEVNQGELRVQLTFMRAQR